MRQEEVDSKALDRRKTLQSPTPLKPEENEQFEKQRTAAIAEVAKTKEVRQFISTLNRIHLTRAQDQGL